MAPILALLAAALVGRSAAVSVSEAKGKTLVTPVQQVLTMLEDMNAKGKREKHDEEVEFAKFHEWCDGVRASRTKSIKEAASQIVQLEADIQKAESDAEVLAQEISDLEAAIAKAEAEMASATGIRDKEHADFTAEHADLSESIDACGRAIQTLRSRSADVPQSLVQLRDMPLVPAHAKAMLTSFLSEPEGEDLGVPEANAYEFQSGGVIAMLEKLTKKFKDQLLALEKAEMNAKANYNMLMQQMTDNVKEDKKIASAKTAAKAGILDDAATAKGDLAATQATKAEDEKALTDATAECRARSEEFEKNQVTRAAEVEAIEKAMEILSSSSVAGHAETYLPTLLQVRAGASSFAQLQSGKPLDPAVRQKVAEFLQARAKKLGSRFLSLAADRAAEDPFAKVKKMIKDMIAKLMEQANSEADAHAYCTSELATNKMTREDKTAEVEELSAKADQLASEIAKLTTEIQELTDAISELKGQQAEATKIRGEEKATNAKTVADAKEAQVAVEKATEVLRDYYAKAADASLLQTAQASQAPYSGQQSGIKGVLGMLEVILSDFARLEADTSTAEEAAATAYASFMAETNESVAVKETAVDHKTNKRQLTDETLLSVKKELSLTQDELDEAMKYYDELKAQCLDAGVSYEERKKAREEEIQSLKEALDILNQQDLA